MNFELNRGLMLIHDCMYYWCAVVVWCGMRPVMTKTMFWDQVQWGTEILFGQKCHDSIWTKMSCGTFGLKNGAYKDYICWRYVWIR
jgi:hypothetical protein